MRYHLDTDFLLLALSSASQERTRLLELAESEADIQISAIAWYEFSRGPRTPEQLAVARSLFFEDGVVPFSEEIATIAAEVFRNLGSPRRRAADIAIGVTASCAQATLLTRNARNFAGVPQLQTESSNRDHPGSDR